MCLVKQYCLASKSYSALASFCWTGILKIISNLFSYLLPSLPPLYYLRSSGRGIIKFLITNQIYALLRSEAIFPVKQSELFPAGQLNFCQCCPSPLPQETGCSGSDSCPDTASLLVCLHLQPGAAAGIKSRERGGEVSSCKACEVRAMPEIKLNKKQQWKVFLLWVEMWEPLLSHKSDDGQRSPLLHARRQCCSSCLS